MTVFIWGFGGNFRLLKHVMVCLLLSYLSINAADSSGASESSTPSTLIKKDLELKQFGDKLFKEAEALASSLQDTYSKNKRIGDIIVDKLEEGSSKYNNENCIVELGNVYFFSKYKIEHNFTLAYQHFHRASSSFGNPIANRMLGVMFEFGLGVQENLPMALMHYSLAAEGNDYYAECILAYKYANGLGVEASSDASINLYQKASEIVAEQFEQNQINQYPPVKFTNDNDYEHSLVRKNDAVQFYMYNAERGDLSAQVLLGRIFYHGSDGFVQDMSLAQKYFKMAAESGNEVAKGYIGLMYAKGVFFEKDITLAIEYCEEAAKFGSAPAYHCLGHLYETGEYTGVPDFEMAIKNYVKASEKDFADSHYRLGKLLMEYIPSFSLPKSIQYLTLASRHGHILAMLELGKLNLKTPSAESKNMALTFFKSVCKRGAVNQLSFWGYNAYFEGNKHYAFAANLIAAACGLEAGLINTAFMLDSMKSWSLALVFWNRAAQQGFVEGYVKCGDYFYTGKMAENKSPDYELAIKYYTKAESEDSAEAAFNLGLMCETGKGIAVDHRLAQKYYSRSLKLNSSGYLAVFFATKRLGMKMFFIRLFQFKKQIGIIIAVVIGLLSVFYLFYSAYKQSSNNSIRPPPSTDNTNTPSENSIQTNSLSSNQNLNSTEQTPIENERTGPKEEEDSSNLPLPPSNRTVQIFSGHQLPNSNAISTSSIDKSSPIDNLKDTSTLNNNSTTTTITVSHSKINNNSTDNENHSETSSPSSDELDLLNDFEWGAQQ